MGGASSTVIETTSTLLEKLSEDEREYLLFRLVSEKIGREPAPEPIPVHRPDGSLLGHIRPVMPPSAEEASMMHDRARDVDPTTSRPTRELLERMRAGDVEGVRKFAHR
jgi:hypothetical protein